MNYLVKLIPVIPFPQQTLGSCEYGPLFHSGVNFNAYSFLFGETEGPPMCC